MPYMRKEDKVLMLDAWNDLTDVNKQGGGGGGGSGVHDEHVFWCDKLLIIELFPVC